MGLTPPMLLVFVIIGLLPLFSGNEYVIRLLISALMTSALSMAFDFTNGYINICNFGFAAFWGLGAYASGIIVRYFWFSPWHGLFFATVAAGTLGFFIGIISIRLGGIFAACMTWFVSLAMKALATNLVGLTNGMAGLTVKPLLDKSTNMPYFYVMFVMLIVVYVLLRFITNSNMGLAFRAIGQDIEASSSSGVNYVKYKLINFTISCAIAGLIGGVYAHYIGVITPKVMSTDKTVEFMAISFIGGRGTIWGSLICAMVFIPMLDVAKGLMEWRTIIYGFLMIAVMIYYPAGLSGVIGVLKGIVLGMLRRKSASPVKHERDGGRR